MRLHKVLSMKSYIWTFDNIFYKFKENPLLMENTISTSFVKRYL